MDLRFTLSIRYSAGIGVGVLVTVDVTVGRAVSVGVGFCTAVDVRAIATMVATLSGLCAGVVVAVGAFTMTTTGGGTGVSGDMG